MNKECVGSVAAGGPGLAFIAYLKGVAQMPGATIWAVLFFIVILSLGLGSQFVAIEGFVTAVVDMFPRFLRKGSRRKYFILYTCLLSFLIELSVVLAFFSSIKILNDAKSRDTFFDIMSCNVLIEFFFAGDVFPEEQYGDECILFDKKIYCFGGRSFMCVFNMKTIPVFDIKSKQ